MRLHATRRTVTGCAWFTAFLTGLSSAHLVHAELPPEWIEAFTAHDLNRVSELLREAGHDLPVDENGATVLHVAPRFEAGASEAPIFARLLAAGAPVGAADRRGSTPLHLAAVYDCGPCVSQLLEAGARWDARRGDGRTPLHHAGPESQALLLGAGADPGARDEYGRTPLHTNRRPTAALLAPGVGVTDHFGFTPLHLAALDGDDDRVAWLLENGADPDARSTAPYDHHEGGVAPEFDPGHRFEAGQRPYDLAKWQYDRTKWSTSRYTKAKERLEKVTRRKSWRSR